MIASGNAAEIFEALLQLGELFDLACANARDSYSMKSEIMLQKRLLGL